MQIAATVLLTVALPGIGFVAGSLGLAAAAAAGGAAIATGLSGGNLGQILRSAAIAGATAAAFFEVGDLTYGATHQSPPFDSSNFNAANYAENVAGHALVGCVSSAASGGSCQSGAVTAAAGPLINGQPFGVALVENAVLGGAASVAGGGKFANGAITGAFGYLFNACGADPHGCLKAGLVVGGAYGAYSGMAMTAGSGGIFAPIGLGVAGLGTLIGGTIGAISDIIGNAVYIRPPNNAWDADGAKAPGYPGGQPGYSDPKGGPNWVPNPNGGGMGWESGDGNVWVPTGQAGAPGTGTSGPAHGGPHWDVQDPKTGNHDNVRPER